MTYFFNYRIDYDCLSQIHTVKSLINEQRGLVLRITLRQTLLFIWDFRVHTSWKQKCTKIRLLLQNFFRQTMTTTDIASLKKNRGGGKNG